MTHFRTPLTVTLSLCTFAAVAHALVLGPGDYNFGPLPDADPTSLPTLAGSVVASQSLPFTVTLQTTPVGFTGTLNNWITRESSGTLDFYYQISIDTTSSYSYPITPPFTKPLGLAPIYSSGFDHCFTDFYHPTNPADVTPSFPFRSPDGDTLRVGYSDGIVNFNLAPGDTSSFLFRTDATDFQYTGTTELTFLIPLDNPLDPGDPFDSAATDSILLPTFAPVGQIAPEPASLFLLPLALLPISLLRRPSRA
ncbi:MAG TPA: hypothetical protein VM008_02880 [Phycisphaerae bacterium]|nr:hypothetical protein [Phycisphaerae bacterium]